MASNRLQSDHPLRLIAGSWLKKIEQGLRYKKPFSDDAREAMNFFDGPHNWMWKDNYARGEHGYNRSIAPPAFRMQINRVFEAVKLFGSVIYHRNPVRTVSPTKYPFVDPMLLGIRPPAPGEMVDPQTMGVLEVLRQTDAQEEIKKNVATLLEAYLNWTPVELNLKEHTKSVVDEAIIKGAGVWWTELVTIPGSESGPPMKMVGSFYDSIDNLVIDPDFDVMEDMLWCARRCVHPIDEVARMYGLTRDDLKGHLERTAPLRDDDSRRNQRKPGRTNDLCVYWKVWSKTGFGDRLKDSPKDQMGIFDPLGSNCFIVVCEGVEFPLNVPPSVMQEEVDPATGLPPSLLARTAWPIPFHAEPNGWPFVELAFHRKPNYSWPISHIKPGIGELRFLNFAMSFLATRVSTSCETLIGVSKAADQDLKDQILAPSEGGFKIVELSEMLGRSVQDVLSVFQLPQVTGEIWQVIAAVAEMFDRRVGLTELVYGMTRSQFRSAAEAQIKQENISVRPDDMANTLEDAMSLLARREALAARWLLEAQDVLPVLGPVGAAAWDAQVATRNISDIARDYQYRVEAGSARKPNKASRIEQMQAALQTLGPVLQQLIPMGVVEPFNALISDWAKSMDIDPSAYLVPPPPAPPALESSAPVGNATPPLVATGGVGIPEQVPPEFA